MSEAWRIKVALKDIRITVDADVQAKNLLGAVMAIRPPIAEVLCCGPTSDRPALGWAYFTGSGREQIAVPATGATPALAFAPPARPRRRILLEGNDAG